MNLQNLVDYCKGHGVDAFQGAYFPAPLDKDTAISAIMIRCGLLTPVYGDPEVFINATKNWFDRKQWTFQHLINIIQAEYSPIENYDRYHDETAGKNTSDIHTGGYSENGTSNDDRVLSGSDAEKHTGKDTDKASGTDTTTNTISAFNSSTYQPDNESKTTYGKQNDLTHGHTITTEYGKIDKDNSGYQFSRSYNEQTAHTGDDTLKQHSHGNIGVTTNQQMIEQELELLRHFDIYGYIAEQFENDNMIMIY